MHSDDGNSLVSIIVPVYCVARYLSKCIQSLINQSYSNLEIILIDDGSPDECPSICDSYAKLDPRIKVFHQKNGGLSSARNSGLAKCSGEYVLLVDSDDFVDPELVRKCMNAVNDTSADLVAFKFDRFSDSGERVPSNSLPRFPAGEVSNGEEAVSHLLMGHVQSYAWAFVARKVLYDGEDPIRFPVGELMEDVSTTYKVFAKASKVTYLNDILYHYRIRQGSILMHITPNLVDSIFLTAVTRSRDICSAMPQLEKCTKINLASSLIPGLIALDSIRSNMNKESYERVRKRYIDEIIKLPYFDVSSFLSAKNFILFTLIKIHLDKLMRFLFCLRRSLSSISQ